MILSQEVHTRNNILIQLFFLFFSKQELTQSCHVQQFKGPSPSILANFFKYHFYDLKITFVYTGVIPENINVKMYIHSKYEYFEDENHIFGQTIWLLHNFL